MPEEAKGQVEVGLRPSVFAARRRFIQWGMAALGAAWIGAGLQSVLFPQPAAERVRPVNLTLADLPIGGARQINYAGKPAIVLRSAETTTAFSLVCTHLGCTVDWQAGKKQFHCPCHDGIFDQFGEVISGPPPVPLEQLPVTVTGEQVIVGA
jgi:Rieske Fe-S protein